jgi:hypothetical protein
MVDSPGSNRMTIAYAGEHRWIPLVSPTPADQHDLLIKAADEKITNTREQITKADEQIARVHEELSRLESVARRQAADTRTPATPPPLVAPTRGRPVSPWAGQPGSCSIHLSRRGLLAFTVRRCGEVGPRPVGTSARPGVVAVATSTFLATPLICG